MIEVHHLNNSRSQRVLWMLEELAVDYNVTRHERDPVTMLAPASLKAVHPLGKSPVIRDGEQIIAESAVILEYLTERYGAASSLRRQARQRICRIATGCITPRARSCSSC